MCNLHWCYTFCTDVTLFVLVLHLNCTALLMVYLILERMEYIAYVPGSKVSKKVQSLEHTTF